MGGNNEMHSRDSKSWEWGITLTSLCFRLSNEMALTSSLSIGQVHHHFKDNYVLSTENGVSAMTPIEGETLKKSYISYNVLRLPIMLEWQKRIGCHDAFLALGPSVEYRWHEHSRYFIGKHKHTETGDINLNPIGLNLEARAGYSGVMLYARAGVTPLLKKTKAPECYPMTIGLGLDCNFSQKIEKMPEYHKRGSRNTTHMLFQNPKIAVPLQRQSEQTA